MGTCETINKSYRLGIRIEASSEAMLKFWKLSIRRMSALVEGEPYRLALEFTNLTQASYPGGELLLVIVWASRSKSYWKLHVPPLGQNETKSTLPVRRDFAGSAGLGLVYCHSLTSKDGMPVTLWNKDGSECYGIGKDVDHAIHGLQCITWVDLYTKYGLIISAFGLGVVAVEALISFLFWIFRFLVPVVMPARS